MAPTVLLSPTNLTATPGDGQVTLSWAPAAGASGYSVYRRQGLGPEGSLQPILMNWTETSCTDGGLANGAPYCYVVRARNAHGESAPSNEACATPTAAHAALTVCQPHVEAIFAGCKKIEYRTWSTNHRGPLLIHAATRRPKAGDWNEYPTLNPGPVPLGAIVGVVDLTDCEPVEFGGGGDEVETEYRWHLASPRRFRQPIPFAGRLRIFEVPDTLVKEQLIASARVE